MIQSSQILFNALTITLAFVNSVTIANISITLAFVQKLFVGTINAKIDTQRHVDLEEIASFCQEIYVYINMTIKQNPAEIKLLTLNLK